MRSLAALENHDVLNLKPKEWLRVKSCQCQLQLSAYSLRFDLVNVLQWKSVQQLTPFSFNKDFSSKSQTLSNSLETFLIDSKKRRQRYWPSPAKHSYKWTQALRANNKRYTFASVSVLWCLHMYLDNKISKLFLYFRIYVQAACQ